MYKSLKLNCKNASPKKIIEFNLINPFKSINSHTLHRWDFVTKRLALVVHVIPCTQYGLMVDNNFGSWKFFLP